MSKTLILFFIVVVFTSCSLLKQTPKRTPIFIDQQQLDSIIEISVNELIEGKWLSDYLLFNNQRPILVTSKFSNKTNAYIDTLSVYEGINMALISSGQVRVVKLSENERQKEPNEITKGKSIDYAISTEVENFIADTSSTLLFGLYLWNDKSNEPIVTISKEIK